MSVSIQDDYNNFPLHAELKKNLSNILLSYELSDCESCCLI